MGHILHIVSVISNTSFLNNHPEYYNISGWGEIIDKDIYNCKVFIQPEEWRTDIYTPTHTHGLWEGSCVNE